MRAASIHQLYAQRGDLTYDGEGVSQLQHGWQCAQLARRAGASPALELAAWLHDLGHLLTDLEGSPSQRGIDDGHESLGARMLARAFVPAVSRPVALHVQAKRYLVGVAPDYLQGLSPDSLRSLALQGGAMDAREAADFIVQPQAQEAVRLRAWDDRAKDPAWALGDRSRALADLCGLMDAVGFGGAPP
jgi:phosphonate degradation associated HDIG domain protein